MLGTAKRVTVTKDDTTIVGGGGQPEMIEARKNELKANIERTTSDFDREKLEERLAKLSGGVAVVKVGGATEAEMKEKVPLVRNAVNATRAAVAEGVLPGGGTALILAVDDGEFLASHTTDRDVTIGIEIVAKACEAPLRQIAANAGHEGGEIIGEIRRRGLGWNAATDTFEDLIASGVLDPTRVTRTALQSAGSIAGLLLITESLVVDDLEAMKKVKDALPNQGPGMTGMGY